MQAVQMVHAFFLADIVPVVTMKTDKRMVGHFFSETFLPFRSVGYQIDVLILSHTVGNDITTKQRIFQGVYLCRQSCMESHPILSGQDRIWSYPRNRINCDRIICLFSTPKTGNYQQTGKQ